MKDQKSIKISFFLVWALLFLIYFSSELVLRVYYVYGDGDNSKESLKELSNKLPGFVTDVFNSKAQNTKSRDLLAKALKGGDKNTIIKAYYSHADSLSHKDRENIYREILRSYPKDPESLTAFIGVLSDKDKKYNISTFLIFIKSFSKIRKARLLSQIWHKSNTSSPKTKKIFLDFALKEELVHGNFVAIYDELQTFAYKLKMSYKVEQTIEKLKAKCVLHRQRLNRALKKKNELRK